MTLSDVEKRAAIAKAAGFKVEELDYGWTTVAYAEKGKRNVILTEVFRSERDGYIGSRMIALDLLQEWIKEHS